MQRRTRFIHKPSFDLASPYPIAITSKTWPQLTVYSKIRQRRRMWFLINAVCDVVAAMIMLPSVLFGCFRFVLCLSSPFPRHRNPFVSFQCELPWNNYYYTHSAFGSNLCATGSIFGYPYPSPPGVTGSILYPARTGLGVTSSRPWRGATTSPKNWGYVRAPPCSRKRPLPSSSTAARIW